MEKLSLGQRSACGSIIFLSVKQSCKLSMIYIFFFPPVFSSFLVCIQHCKTVRWFSPFYLDLKCPYCADGFSLHPLSRFPSDLRLLTVFGDSQNEPASTRIFFFQISYYRFCPTCQTSFCMHFDINKKMLYTSESTYKEGL